MSKDRQNGLLASLAWLALCGQHSASPSAADPMQTDRRVGDSLANIATTYERQAKAKSSRPCKVGNDQRDSSLCADWKAADAAADAAWWAGFAGWFGGFNLLGVLGALGLAFHSNRIARDTGKRQLRAYVGVLRIYVHTPVVGQVLRGTIDLKNFGQTPAYSYDASTHIAVGPVAIDNASLDIKDPIVTSPSVLQPGAENHAYAITSSVWEQEHADQFATGELAIYLFGRLDYRDTFGVARYTKFRSRYDYRCVGQTTFQCMSGNESS